jgi:hypothetical protein
MKMKEEEERRVRLERRLEPNVDFSDNTLQVLDSTQILSNLGWVQFFMELV